MDAGRGSGGKNVESTGSEACCSSGGSGSCSVYESARYGITDYHSSDFYQLMAILGSLEPRAWAMVGTLGISVEGRDLAGWWGEAFLGTLCPLATLSKDERDSSAWAEPEGP